MNTLTKAIRLLAVDVEQADKQAYEIAAWVSNVSSTYYMSDFPGMDALGLDPDKSSDKHIADAICCAIRAGESFKTVGDDSAAFGSLAVLLQHGIVTIQDIKNSLHKYWLSKQDPDSFI